MLNKFAKNTCETFFSLYKRHIIYIFRRVAVCNLFKFCFVKRYCFHQSTLSFLIVLFNHYTKSIVKFPVF